MENIKIALRSVKANFLRSFLTLIIISIGIACLVGILTAIDTVLFSMTSNFSRLGANSYSIYPKRETIKSNNRGRQVKRADPILFDQAMAFKDRYTYTGANASVRLYCNSNTTLKYKEEKTNPTVNLIAIDEAYLGVSAYDLAAGRNFSRAEVESGQNKVVLGSDQIEKLFKGKAEKAIGEVITLNNQKYKIIGALASKGSSMNGSSDNRAFIPLMKGKILYGGSNTNYSINVSLGSAAEMNEAQSAAIGIMRNIRRLRASEDNDFEFRSSGSILETLNNMTGTLQISAIIIALMTLLGAAIGLMNIMLVTVTERTKEIGVRKALGATSNNVLMQFLTEAVVVCQLGGLFGIFLGILVGIGVASMVKGPFIMPWAWIILAIIVCLIVGVLSGLYPALKASRLDPIESLRYE